MMSSEKSHPRSSEHEPERSADAPSFNTARKNPNRFPLPPAGVSGTDECTRADYIGALRVRTVYGSEGWEYHAWRDWRRWGIFVVIVFVWSGVTIYYEHPFFTDGIILIFMLFMIGICLWIKDFFHNLSSSESVGHMQK
jgi:hypothetical protein